MIQKFKKMEFVHIEPMSGSMSHFEGDCDAIIEASYFQQYGGGENQKKSYGVYLIKDGKVVNNVSWYEEHQLTLLPIQDKLKALAMVEAYELGDEGADNLIEEYIHGEFETLQDRFMLPEKTL